ncbi:MAG: hypothetical protein ACYCX9_11725 [Candidatus Dormibacteria bacterium]
MQDLPLRRRGHWASFVADTAARGRVVRGLHEEQNPLHRLRVEHDARTLLIHLSDEDGDSWTAVAVDRATRLRTVPQGRRQVDAAREAHGAFFGRDGLLLRTPEEGDPDIRPDDPISGLPG